MKLNCIVLLKIIVRYVVVVLDRSFEWIFEMLIGFVLGSFQVFFFPLLIVLCVQWCG